MWKALRSLLIKTTVLAAVTYILMTFVFGVFYVRGNNMYPMVKDGDLVITFRLEEYNLKDVVLYNTGSGVKLGRITAMPGDIIEADEFGIKINGGYPGEEIFYETTFGDENFRHVNDTDEFFIMNDFREDINDSRTYGGIKVSDVKGKAIYVFRRRNF